MGQRMAAHGTCGPAGRPEGGTDCTALAQRDRDKPPSRSRSSAPGSRAAPRTGRSRFGEPAKLLSSSLHRRPRSVERRDIEIRYSASGLNFVYNVDFNSEEGSGDDDHAGCP